VSFWIFRKEASGRHTLWSVSGPDAMTLIVIIGILATMVFTRISDRPERARAARLLGTCLPAAFSDLHWLVCEPVQGSGGDVWFVADADPPDVVRFVQENGFEAEPWSSCGCLQSFLAGPPGRTRWRHWDFTPPVADGNVFVLRDPAGSVRALAAHQAGRVYLHRRRAQPAR